MYDISKDITDGIKALVIGDTIEIIAETSAVALNASGGSLPDTTDRTKKYPTLSKGEKGSVTYIQTDRFFIHADVEKRGKIRFNTDKYCKLDAYHHVSWMILIKYLQ